MQVNRFLFSKLECQLEGQPPTRQTIYGTPYHMDVDLFKLVHLGPPMNRRTWPKITYFTESFSVKPY